MALISCGECYRTASDQAAACPHCGSPIAEKRLPESSVSKKPVSRNVGFGLGVGIFFVPLVFVWFLLRGGHSAASRVVGFAWLALFLFGVAVSERARTQSAVTPSSEARPAKSAALTEPLPEVSAQQLAQAYERNTVAADQQFKGKRFKVTGVVDSINADLFGKPYVTLLGGVNQFMQPQFKLDSAHVNYAASLQKGMRIALECKGRGDVAKTPMSDECIPAS
jgi:hypothetical protein